jgi:hypothetical protein
MRRKLLLATTLLLAGLLLAWAVWRRWLPEGYGTLFAGGSDDELLGDLLDLTERDSVARLTSPARETSEEVDIDGRAGKLCLGWQSNGKPCYEKRWVGDRQHGREVWWDERGQIAEEMHWKDGCLHGRYTRWYANGKKAEEAGYDRFRLHGTHRTWHRDGTRASEISYRDGLREGEFTVWHPNGAARCRTSFKKDRLHGPWKEWDAEGNLVTHAEYRDGVCTTRTPNWGQEPGSLGSTDFALVLAQGSGWHGFNVLRVSAAGRCEFRYFFTSKQVSTDRGEVYITQVWRKAGFQLSDQEQQRLRNALKAADVFGLKDEYIDERIADGTQWIVRLRAGGRQKRVYLSNRFPERLRQLSRSIREQVMAPHRMELVTATRVAVGRVSPDEEAWPEDAK